MAGSNLPEMRKNADPRERSAVTELTFALSDPSYPFVGASGAESCRFDLEEIVPRGGGRYAEFFTVSDADPDRILTLAERRDAVEPHLLGTHASGGLFEFSVGDYCPAVALAERGALPRRVESEDGAGRIVAELPPRYDPAAVVESFLDECPGAEFVATREKDHASSLFGGEAFRQALRDHLTERQREVLEAAYAAGYYDWPRDCTGEEVADDLGIASATFSQHIHAAERKLLSVVFEGTAPRTDGAEPR